MDSATGAAARLALLDADTDVSVARRVYDEWAPTYDGEDVAALMGHRTAAHVADRVLALVRPDTEVLDAGCGTGLVGAELAVRGFRSIDGLDLSPGMLRRARRRGVYHDLGPADLRVSTPGASGKFGVLTCVGALAPGHLGPGALVGLVRVLRPGGFLVATVAEDAWMAGGYDRALGRLTADGYAEVVEDGADGDGPGRLLVLEAREVPGPGRSVIWIP
ncbi:class I SAM-dependent methyltransferase [Actinomycetospora lutea]|uniref:class I SAM-dependent DNA methyltransferase n=1 Tax=Actinomycetospora lutea TaxID=663604 RepID=UPI0023673D0E|nr:class I SAM-dependent methyltransferase [Actinomycetospora lutea]MDD7937291.1 class I SAM-dependent methyltransferase [Actinomycetospora lutea]